MLASQGFGKVGYISSHKVPAKISLEIIIVIVFYYLLGCKFYDLLKSNESSLLLAHPGNKMHT